MPKFLGPGTLQIEGQPDANPGDEVTLDPKVQAALEKAGLYFSDTDAELAPQSAAENLADQGTTAEQQADAANLSAPMGTTTTPTPTTPITPTTTTTPAPPPTTVAPTPPPPRS